ncbi:MAG TPA: biotin-dependent carboxyltransferase family protein [Chitinophagaceae bacterium]|jgi:antagonist of KipI|nr:biotin-dependent carboxyltransferase family protein [Chitinophagaceae bacterium]
MSLKIVKAGMLDSIQDMGRYGYQQVGINPTGAIDKYAAVIANILVGNTHSEAVIEMRFPAAAIFFDEPTIIALSGAEFNASINGNPIPINHAVIVNKNTTLQFLSPKNKSHCYLAIKGGMKLSKWLNSYSTNLKAEAGGFSGRRLLKDDVIELNEYPGINKIDDSDFKILPWQASENFGMDDSEQLMVLQGAEWEWLDKNSQEKFLKNPFFISHNSDRMGYRLASEPLHAITKTELVSSAVSFGSIQLLPDGQLIILMADNQTTGGYPRLGNIISAYLPMLAQMKAGDKVQFKFTDHQTAENLILKQQQHLTQLEIACKLRLENYIHENDRY